MSLQMRPKGGPMQEVRYSPARDVVYLYANVMERVEKALYDESYKPLGGWMRESGVTDADIAETIRIFCLVLNDAHKNPEESLWDIMDRLNFNRQPPAARVAMMYYVGTLMTGTWFQGIRDVVELGDDTIPEITRLVETGERMAEYAALSPLGRWWVRFKHRWLKSGNYRSTIGGVHQR